MPYGLSAFFPSPDPIPGPRGWFEALSFLTFTAHILFMNTVLGTLLITFFRSLVPSGTGGPSAEAGTGSPSPPPIMTPPGNATLFESIGMLPKALAITVNLGVAPLLFVQVGYGQFFYSSAIIQGMWWLGLMLLVMMAYYGLYLYPTQQNKGTRTFILGLCTAMLLITALIQTTNAALVLNPEVWPDWLPDRGSALFLTGVGIVIPRLLHTILATFAVGGLFMAIQGEMRRKKGLPDQAAVISEGLTWFKHATLGQFVVGSWYFLSLTAPQQRILMESPVSHALYACIFAGIFLSLWFASQNQTWRTTISAVLVISLMIAVRAFLRNVTLLSKGAPSPQEFTTAPSVFAVFGLSLVGSLLVIIWMLRLAQKAYAQSNDDSHSSDDQTPGNPRPETQTPSAVSSGEVQS